MRRISMATRDELLPALAKRYRSSKCAEKGLILKEFSEVSGNHRKHPERLLRRGRLRIAPGHDRNGVSTTKPHARLLSFCGRRRTGSAASGYSLRTVQRRVKI
jgi:hypothetical protein